MRGTRHPAASEHFHAGHRTLSRLPPREALGGTAHAAPSRTGPPGNTAQQSRNAIPFERLEPTQTRGVGRMGNRRTTMPDTPPIGSNAECPRKSKSSGRAQIAQITETGISPTHARKSRPTSTADAGNGITRSVASNAAPPAPGLPSAARSTPSSVARARKSERYTGPSARSIGRNV